MPAPAAPPPAKTTIPAAPSVAPKPAAAPPPAAKPPPPAREAFDPNSELEGLDDAKSAAPAAKVEAPSAKVASPDAKVESEGAKPAASDDDDGYVTPIAKQEAPAAPPAAPEPVKAPELRQAYQNAKAKVTELEKQVAELRAKPPEEPERKAFTEQITTLKKQLEDATGRLNFVAYEQSDEFKQKYQEPFEAAWNDGVAVVSDLTAINEDGTQRKGTAEDFAAIMAEPNNGKAAAMAAELFEASAAYVINQRRELQRLNAARNKALTEHRQTAAERAKAESEQTLKAKTENEARHAQRIAKFAAHVDEAIKKYPQFLAPVEGDDEGNALLTKGFELADRAFKGGVEMTEDETVRLHATIRNRAAAFGRLAHQVRTKDAKIAELQQQLDEIRASTPDGGRVKGGGESGGVLDADAELDALDRQG